MATTQKTALITGGNRGLGFLMSKKLAQAGYHVVIGARSEKNASDAIAQLKKDVPGANVEAIAVDVSSLASVRAVADEVKKRGLSLNVLVNNAGIMTAPDEPMHKTADGFEATFATNVLGPALLTLELLPNLRASSSPSQPSRVVNIGSRSINGFSGMGGPAQFDFENIDGHKQFAGVEAYKNSKLAFTWFTYEMARKLKDKSVTVNMVCPGFVPETAGEHAKGFQRFLFKHVLTHVPGAHSADEASDNLVWVITDDALADVTGGYFGEKKPVDTGADSKDTAKAARLWDTLWSMANVDQAKLAQLDLA